MKNTERLSPKQIVFSQEMTGWKKVITFILWFVHPIEGALTIVFYYCLWGGVNPCAAVLWFAGYMLYEFQEYRETPDTCAIDIRDFLIGFFVACVYVLVRKAFWG